MIAFAILVFALAFDRRTVNWKTGGDNESIRDAKRQSTAANMLVHTSKTTECLAFFARTLSPFYPYDGGFAEFHAL
jgi:hypothetical protein